MLNEFDIEIMINTINDLEETYNNELDSNRSMMEKRKNNSLTIAQKRVIQEELFNKFQFENLIEDEITYNGVTLTFMTPEDYGGKTYDYLTAAGNGMALPLIGKAFLLPITNCTKYSDMTISAFIIAHEYGHIEYAKMQNLDDEDRKPGDYDSFIEEEIFADNYAIDLLHLSRDDILARLHFFMRRTSSSILAFHYPRLKNMLNRANSI